MIAVINNAVAGAGIAFLLLFLSPSAPYWVAGVAGVLGALVLTWLFYVYQRWRMDEYDVRTRQSQE
jgi:ABC-type cobalamin transport system permease subunit